MAPSRYRFDLEISITWSLARWTPAAPRIHGELLKIGITVSQATVSRYMPTSRKGRRSQAWQTFIRNHAITITQSQSLNGHNLARDLLSHVRSRSSVFTYRLSATVVAPVTGPSSLGVWHTVHPLLVAVARSCVRFTRIVTLITKFAGVGVSISGAARKACLLDRIRDPPIAQELKRNADPLINALNWQGVSFARSTRAAVPVLDPNYPIPKPQLLRIGSPPQTNLLILYLGPHFRGPV
jgi:hypothetical protein